MFIQGNLQEVFDVLFEMGVINPVLKADWAPADKAMRLNPRRLHEVVAVVNHNSGNKESIKRCLKSFDEETLMFLAMEVAREFIDFEDRKTVH